MDDADAAMWLEQSRSSDPARQVEAVPHLLKLDAQASVVPLIEMLQSRDAVVRQVAAEALGRIGPEFSERIGPALLDLLGDPEVIVRSEAADSLGILGYAPATNAIKALLLKDPEALVRAAAAETLGDLGNADAVRELELALSDPEEVVRSYAANSIGLLGAPSMLPRLQSYAEYEKSPVVKAELHGARYRLGAAGDVDELLKLLESDDAELAPNIVNLLNDLIRRNAPPTLAADGLRLRAAVTTFAQRNPLLSADAQQAIEGLAKLEAAH